MPHFAHYIILLAGLLARHATATDSRAAAADYVCRHPPYEPRVVSSSPLVVYLAGFITPDERAHLIAATRDSFAQSAVAGRRSADDRAVHSVRTSQSTSVPRDAVVQCIEARALLFQGFLPGDSDSDSDSAAIAQQDRLEPLQLVKYAAGEHYHYHTDWFTDPVHATAAQGGNRASSFFAYIHAGNESARLRGGGTNFPLLDAPGAGAWCALIDCDEPWESGVTFRPVAGSAVFWENLVAGVPGQGDPRTLHAGLPVVRGEKIGLNIWTRQGRLPKDIV